MTDLQQEQKQLQQLTNNQEQNYNQTSINHQMIPEDLYNLTQLAEVTLAAGYINKDKIEIENNYNIKNSIHTQLYHDYSKTPNEIKQKKNIEEINNSNKKDEIRDEDYNKCIRKETETLDDYYPKSKKDKNSIYDQINYDKIINNNNNSYNNIDSINNNNNYNCNLTNIQSSTPLFSSLSLPSHINIPPTTTTTNTISSLSFTNDHKDLNTSKISSQLSSTSSSLFAYGSSSFSDDETSSRYSHKIFDRKASRRSTYSERMLDDHSSLSSSCSCNSTNSNDDLIDNTNNCKKDNNEKRTKCLKRKLSSTKDNELNSINYEYDKLARTTRYFKQEDNLLDKLNHQPQLQQQPQEVDILTIGGIEDEHICPECGKKYSTSSNLARHRQTHRSISDKKARKCSYCDKVYVSMPAYAMHMRTHNQGCKCEHCGKCFSRPWLLQGHIRTHTGEKPFNCNICSKAFADKSNLRAHIQTHSNTKPHSCRRCGKSFALKSYLYKHEESSCMRNHLKQEKQSRIEQSNKVNKSSATKSTLATKILQKEQYKNQNKTNQQYNTNNQQEIGVVLINNDQNQQTNYPNNWSSSCPTSTYEYSSNSQNLLDDNQKSYTTLTAPTTIVSSSHTNSVNYIPYSSRISVIQPPIGTCSLQNIGNSSNLDHIIITPISSCGETSSSETMLNTNQNIFFNNTTSLSHHNNNLINHNHLNHHNHHTNNANANLHQQHQENPVDYSPKNQFTHSIKTSPFELTRSYAMVF